MPFKSLRLVTFELLNFNETIRIQSTIGDLKLIVSNETRTYDNGSLFKVSRRSLTLSRPYTLLERKTGCEQLNSVLLSRETRFVK